MDKHKHCYKPIHISGFYCVSVFFQASHRGIDSLLRGNVAQIDKQAQILGRNCEPSSSSQKDFKKSFVKIFFGLLDSGGLTILRKKSSVFTYRRKAFSATQLWPVINKI
jgi:hypothetical protein